METRLTLRPGMPGTKKLQARFGDRLVCVRYLYDRERRRVDYHENPLRHAVKTAGGIWRSRQRLWELSWDAVRVLGLQDRVVDGQRGR
jgi:hypothetical protein